MLCLIQLKFLLRSDETDSEAYKVNFIEIIFFLLQEIKVETRTQINPLVLERWNLPSL